MVRRKNKYKTPMIIGIIVLAILAVPYVFSGATYYISGYGGLVADFKSVDYDHPTQEIPSVASTRSINLDNKGTVVSIDPDAYYSSYLVTSDPSGVTMSIGSVNILETSVKLPSVEIPSGGEVEASVAKCELNIEFRTSGTGLDPLRDAVFSIRIEENAFDVFNDADDVESYIMEVYTIGAVMKNKSNLNIIPSAGGIPLVMTPLKTDTATPQWIIDAGYQKHVNDLKAISIDLEVDKAVPYWEVGLFGPIISHVGASVKLGIDMLVFGWWDQTGDNHEYKPTPDDLTFMDILGTAFAEMIDIMGPMMAMVTIIVVGVVIIVIIIRFGGLMGKSKK